MSFLFNVISTMVLATSVHSYGDDPVTPATVSISDFKAGFETSAIVPEVLAAFNPSVGFFVGFTGDDAAPTLLTPGLALSLQEAKAPFELSVQNIHNTTGVTSSTRFIVYMIGPDVPSRSTPTSRNVRHFLAGNLTLSAKNSSLIPSATVFQNLSAATNEYAAPAPSPNTGSHRYVYLLYTQPTALNTRSFASLGFNATLRTGFNVTSFKKLTGIGSAIGGTFFMIDTPNTTTTTNSAGAAAGTATSTYMSGSSAASTGLETSLTSVAAVVPRVNSVVTLGTLVALLGAAFVAFI